MNFRLLDTFLKLEKKEEEKEKREKEEKLCSHTGTT